MIGIYDSGIGGITVLASLLKELPNEEYFYVADYQNAPYGDKTKDALEKIVTKNMDIFMQKRCKAIVIACNTAGTLKDTIRKKYDIPIIVIEPAIKMAYDRHKEKKTLILTTPYTAQSKSFHHLYKKYEMKDCKIFACKDLATLIEEGNEKKIKKYVKKLFLPYQDVEQVILGCTHYPLIQRQMKEILPQVMFYDGGLGTAKQTKRILARKKLLSISKIGTIHFFFTDQKDRTEKFQKVLDDYTNHGQL